MSSSSEFIKLLVDAMPTPQARLMCLSVLAQWAGTSIYLPMESKSDADSGEFIQRPAKALHKAQVQHAVRVALAAVGRYH